MKSTKSTPMERIYHSSVTWKIFNFLNGQVEVNKRIISPVFFTNLRKPIKWRLAITGMKKIDERYVTKIVLQRSASCSGPKHLVVKLKISLFDSNGEVWKDIFRDVSFYPGTDKAFKNFKKFDNITNYYDSAIFKSGNITITCDFLLDFALYLQQSAMDLGLRALSNDLRTFHMIDYFTDLDLKVGEKTFAVHSVIVKARSPLIARILKENPRLREIDLTGCGSDMQIRGLIVYWYSGDTEKIPRSLCPSISEFIGNMKQFELRPYVEPEKIILYTTFETLNWSIKWIIEDYQFCEKLKHLQKRLYYKYTFAEQPWKLHFYPKGPTGNANYISLCVEEQSRTVVFKSVYLEIYFTDENGTEYGRKSIVSCQPATWLHVLGKYSFIKFMTHGEFVSLKETLLKDNILRIGCRIKYGTGKVKCFTEYFSSCQTIKVIKGHPYITLASNLKHLLQSGYMSNISLKVGDRIFKVHTPILAARSRYFEQLVRNRELDAYKNDEVELRDIEPEDLDLILKYMYYAEKIQLNQDLALRLYPVVHEYEIPILKTFCSEYLESHLAVGNAIAVLELADKYKGSALKRSAIETIDSNWDHISKTKRWQMLQNDNSKLALEIMSEIMSKECNSKQST